MTGKAGPRTGWLVAKDGTRLHTVSWDVQAPRSRLLLVHGLGDHSGRYRELAEALASRGHEVVSYDQRGHGRSDGRRGDVPTFTTFVADLNLLAGPLVSDTDGRPADHGGVPTFLMGHSMGGLVVLRYLQTYRPTVTGVILSSPWLGTEAPVPAWKRRLGRIVDSLAPGVAMPTGMKPQLLTRDPERLARWADDDLYHSRVSPRLFESAEEAQAAALGASVDVDTMFLVPGDDRLVDAGVTLAYAVGQDPRATTVVKLPRFRHEVWNDLGREEVFAKILEWMEERCTAQPDDPATPGGAT